MTLVADPQKKLTTTLLLRPKLRLKRGWPRPKPWPGTNVPYNNNGLDPSPCRVAAKEKRRRWFRQRVCRLGFGRSARTPCLCWADSLLQSTVSSRDEPFLPDRGLE